METPELYIEALVFASEQSIRVEEIIYCLQAAFERDFSVEEVIESLDHIKAKYLDEKMAIELVNLNNGYQFLTKKAYHPVISLLQLQRSKKKLSSPLSCGFRLRSSMVAFNGMSHTMPVKRRAR